jgi:hypothetical protein
MKTINTIKSKRDYKNDIGLGFATIVTKISKSIKIEFKEILKNIN